MAFRFERPAGWEYKAGQFVDITLLQPPETDSKGNVRGFSIASAPHEQTIMVATRMRNSAFKRVLASMPLHSAVSIEGPFGDLVLHRHGRRPAIMLAGGIGVTPFYSIAQQAAHEQLPHRIVLFHSNHRPEDAPFLLDLTQLAMWNANYLYVPTMTAPGLPRWQWRGEIGLIRPEMLSKHLHVQKGSDPSLAGAMYYLAGPPAMVADMRKMLLDWGADADNIRVEEFAGY